MDRGAVGGGEEQLALRISARDPGNTATIPANAVKDGASGRITPARRADEESPSRRQSAPAACGMRIYGSLMTFFA